MQIGRWKLRNSVVLAPMSGISDLPFRELCWASGAGLVVSEMTASKELCRDRADHLLKAKAGSITPHVVQLAGREARWMAEGARIAVDLGADIIDINMGCPARHVTKGLSGSALMRDLDHAMELIEATLGAVSVPVTLKMRLGWDAQSMNAPELGRRAQDAGVAALTVHGRTRQQFFKGTADWRAVKSVTQAVSIPVLVNGDIKSADDAATALEQSGADGVMVGRAACGQPWLLGDIADQLHPTATIDAKPSRDKARARADIVASHYEAMLSHYGIELGGRNARKHLAWYVDASPIADHQKRDASRALCSERDPKVVIGLIHDVFCAERTADASAGQRAA